MAVLDKKNIEEIFDLTPLQEGLLFHYLKEDRDHHQNFEQICLAMEGCLDVDKFTEAWNTVVRNNEMLRTVFRWKKLNKPVQLTLREHTVAIRFIDLTGLSEAEQEKRFREIRVQDKAHLFDLEAVPFRITLVKFSGSAFTQVISNHSIIYDGWSNGILLREFFQNYLSLLGGQNPTPPSKANFKDFVKLVRTAPAQDECGYWSNYFSARAEKSDLLIRHQQSQGLLTSASHAVDLTRDMAEKITAFCAANKITKAAFFYAVWGIVLQKISNAHDVIFGTTVSGRSARLKGIENMVGLLINTLPLRVRATGQSAKELLKEIAFHLTEREKFEHTPLLKIKEYGNFALSEDLFESIVLIENYPLDKSLFYDDERCRITGFTFDQTNNFDLALSILNFEQDIQVFFGYNNSKYTEATVRQLGECFVNIASAILEFPDRDIRALELVSPAEREEILVTFNDTKKPYSSDKFIQDLFIEQAKASPDSIALVAGDEHVTYGALEVWSAAVASQLLGAGGNRNLLVPVIMDRTPEMIAALLGILRAGYAYVPLEPTLPKARIQKLVNALSAECVVTDIKNLTLAESVIESGKMIFYFQGRDAAGQQEMQSGKTPLSTCAEAIGCAEPNIPGRANTDIAYIIYTSGSTGLPKGVVVQHRPVLNIIEWVNQNLNVTAKDKLLFVTSLGFDLSVYDIFGVLAAGATIRLASREALADPQALLEIIAREQITIWDSAPAAFQQVVQVGSILKNSFGPNMLRMAMLSGDWIGLQLPAMAKKLFGHTKVVSLGGATEAVIWSNYFLFDKVEEHWTSIPYGRPIQNAKYYILDDDLNVLPKGVIGELFIGGECLAWGYINEPELTDRKFIANPFTKGERLYRTGDLARWFSDGNIELIGRRDHQVKVRGFRIELGEIENRLVKFPQITNATLLVYKGAAGDNAIAAFFESSAEVNTTLLKDYLREELPDFMVPANLIRVAEIPVTPNGKVDRNALLRMIAEEGAPATERRALSATEQDIALLWAEILNTAVDAIHAGSNFFDMGGHSLNATILQARLEKKFDVRIPLRQLFNNPTLASLAQNITRGAQRAVAITPAPEHAHYPVTSAQRRLYTWQWMNRESTSYNIVGAVKIAGVLNIQVLEQVVRDIVKAQASLRTTFDQVNNELVQFVHDKVDFKLHHHRHEGDPDNIDFEEYVQAFDLGSGPLFRLSVIGTNDAALCYLVLDMHHIIGDGMSVHKFITDLVNGFAGNTIESLPIQYKDYAVWTHGPVYQQRVASQQEFWLSQFNGGVRRLSLPIDFERPAVQSYAGDHVTFEMHDAHVAGIRRLMEITDATMFVTMLSLMNVLLARLCKQTDITIGTPVANRPHADLMPVMGMFVNTLVLRHEVTDDLKVTDLVRLVRTNCIRAFENQDYPFERLASVLEPQRDPRFNPIFDVALEFDNLDLPELKLPGAAITILENILKRAHFDLVFTIRPAGDAVHFKITYGTQLFERATIQWIGERFLELIEKAGDQPDQLIGELDLFGQRQSNVAAVQFEF